MKFSAVFTARQRTPQGEIYVNIGLTPSETLPDFRQRVLKWLDKLEKEPPRNMMFSEPRPSL